MIRQTTLFLILGIGAHAEPAAPPDWERALVPVPMAFPRDHHAHPAYKTEWWYFTGNLTDGDGQRVGYQFTLFRQGVTPPAATLPDSAWAVRDIGFGHAAVSLPADDIFVFGQVLERGCMDNTAFPAMAGSGGLLARVAGWSVTLGTDGDFDLKAGGNDFAVVLHARPLSPPLLHGDRGLSRKADIPGHASHYYSLPRLATTGTITCRGKSRTVTGLSWLDREWSSSPLAANQIGWDWFALQFDDGRDLMVYRMRRADGSIDPASHGTLRKADGTVVALAAGDFALTPARWWRSPASGGNYPVEWTLSVPSHGLHHRINAVRDNQELALQPVTYYEGAIDAAPIGPATGPAAKGYMEMTGYAAPLEAMRAK